MPTYRKRLGKWRAEVRMQGIYESQTSVSKQEVVAWATRLEAEILAGARGAIPNLTVSDLLSRYEHVVSAKKKGARWESVRLGLLRRDPLAAVRLRYLDSPHASAWQERRLQAVKAASVRRERNLLSAAFEIARKEWRWLRKNPFDGVRRPKDGRARNRIASQDELNRILATASLEMRRAIDLALETGMRASELTGVEVRGRVGYLHDTKNNTSREVPLSIRAQAALVAGPIRLTAGSISAIWAKCCRDANVRGLTFHDLRRTAAVRLAAKLSPLELAKMLGHRDLRMTLNVYYKADMEAVVDKLG